MESTDADGGTRRTRNTRSRMVGDNSKEKTVAIRQRKRLVHKYGNVPEEVGTIYKTRTDLQVVHHPTTNWIHLGPEGPYSIIILKTKRFLDEGSFVVLSTGETRRRYTVLKKNCVEDNLIKALRSHLPIRIIRAIKKGHGAPATFRYDGLYRMKKRFTLYGKLKFLLTRDKNQPAFNWERKTGQILHMLSLVKRFPPKKKRSICIKEECDIKQEVNNTGSIDPERDCTRRTISCWEQLKEETVSINGDEESYAEAVNEEYAVPDWQQERSQYNERENFDESIEIEHTPFVYSTSFCQKSEVIYQDEDIGSVDNNECAQNFLNDDQIIDTMPVFNCVNGENSNNVKSCIIFPENETSVSVKEQVNVDPLRVSDPLEGCNDENKTCHFNNENRTSSYSEESKNCDEKKSTVLYPLTCGKNVDYEGEHDGFIPHPCVYSLTLAQIVNLINGTNNNLVCPCKLSRCNGQMQFEAALKHVIDEQGKLKCIKGGSEDESEKSLEKIDNEKGRALEKMEEKRNYSVDDFFMQLVTPLQIRKKTIIPNGIIKKTGKSTRKFHVKKSVTIEESVTSQEIPPCSPTPLREDVIIPENFNFLKEGQRQVEVDAETTSSPQKRRKKRKSFEAASLGPVIDPNDDNTPRSRKGRKLTYTSGRLTVYQNRRKRSSRNNQMRSEEEGGFIGFVGPIKPSNKIKMIQTYIKKLSKSFF